MNPPKSGGKQRIKTIRSIKKKYEFYFFSADIYSLKTEKRKRTQKIYRDPIRKKILPFRISIGEARIRRTSTADDDDLIHQVIDNHVSQTPDFSLYDWFFAKQKTKRPIISLSLLVSSPWIRRKKQRRV